MATAVASTIKDAAPSVEAEEPLMSEKLLKLKVTELKVGLQRRDF